MTITERLRTAIADRYVIERELGAGGMATVYLAHDVKHDRKVALKVLRPELAAVIGAERFLQEIKVTANLQHSHILPLYDSGAAEGFLFYVMPYVEGETLRTKLEREKQLGVEEAVGLARAIAAALEHAHKQGVVHRDIKPENILLRDNDPLIADFGIALALSHAGGSRLTETGLSIGTPHYMSPEQAMGDRELDARSDVYSLAAVVYEMLTGEPPYTGATAQAIVARVITEEPRSIVLQRRTVPPHVADAVHKALNKLPADRFGSAVSFAEALVTPGYVTPSSTRAGTAGMVTTQPPAWHRAVWPGATVALLAVAAWGWLRPAEAPMPVRRYGLALPAAQAPNPGYRAIPAPDGSRVAYVGPGEDGPQIWVKERDSYVAAPLAGTQGATNFTFSPDGQWLAFVMGQQLKKMPVVGGAAITLTDTVSTAPGLAWLDDGTIVFVRMGGLALHQVPDVGGTSHLVVADSVFVRFPTPLPRGRGVLFTRCEGAVCLLAGTDLRSGRVREIIPGAVYGRYVGTGHVVYVRSDGGVFAVPFDVGTLETRGPSVPVMDSVSVVDGTYPLMELSASGMMLVRTGLPMSLLQRYEMVWVDRGGRETPVDSTWTARLTSFGDNVGWALSPDGTQLAIGLATDAGDDIWVKQLPRGPVSRVSYDGASEYRPRWMPGGESVMFGSNRVGDGAGGLYVRSVDGTGTDSLVLRTPAGVFEGTWSPDGRWLLFRTGGTVAQTGGRDIVGLRPGIDTMPVPLVATPYDEEAIALSPDGRWLAYESNETGRTEVFIRPFPETESGKWQVSNGGGVAPLWARNGRELFYVAASRDMVAVTVEGAGQAPRLGERRPLFRVGEDLFFSFREFYTPHDVGPDGRFVMARRVSSGSSVEVPLVVVENWLEELKDRVGQ